MKKKISFLIAISFLVLSCQRSEKNLDNFYNYLGDEQSLVLQETVDYFNKFLDDNFKNENTKEDKIYKLLEYFSVHPMNPNDRWIYDKEKCKLLIDKFEKTGLRKEFWMYGYETYHIDSSLIKYYENYSDSVWSVDSNKSIDQVVIDLEGLTSAQNDSIIKAQLIEDSLKFFNSKTLTPYSKIIVGIDKFKSGDSLIYNYTNSTLLAGDISSGLLINGLLNADKKSYNDPFFDIIMIKEFFYGLMEYHCK